MPAESISVDVLSEAMRATAPSTSSLNTDEVLKCEATIMVMQVSRGYNVLSYRESRCHADERTFGTLVASFPIPTRQPD